MSVKISDKRCTAAAEVDPEVETERLARRRAVREAAGRRDLELAPALLAEADIRDSELRCDEAADQHAVATAPLQQELSTLEAEAVKRVADRQPADPEADARRAELIGEIGVLTRELEASIEREHELQAELRRKARRIREGHPPADTILAALAKPPLANAKLLGEQFVQRERIRWLRAREQAARKTLAVCQFNVREMRAKRMSGDVAVWRGKVAAWDHELAAVGDEIAQAMTEADRIHKRLLDE